MVATSENTVLWFSVSGRPKISSLNRPPLAVVSSSSTNATLMTLKRMRSSTMSGGKA